MVETVCGKALAHQAPVHPTEAEALKQRSGELTVHKHGFVVAISVHHEAFALVRTVEAYHIEPSESIVRCLMHHDAIRPSGGDKNAKAHIGMHEVKTP